MEHKTKLRKTAFYESKVLRTIVLLWSILFLGFYSGYGQAKEVMIDKNQIISVDEVFDIIKKQTDYRFIYKSDIFKGVPAVKVTKGSISVEKLLSQSLPATGFRFNFKGKTIEIDKVLPQPEQKNVQEDITISGNVVNANDGLGIPGVNVIVKGNPSVGAATDIDGNFNLLVSKDAILVFSAIGMKTIELPVSQAENVVMREDTSLLDEVVVVGYGTQKKSSLTASVSTISPKEVQKQLTTNVASALQGRTPGVEILQKGGEAGADVNILIRGAGTFGSTAPLYVIDGAMSNNGLNSLNPVDISSIEILKDGAAAAIYGSRAANGVVLITTKNGKSGDTLIELSSSYAYQTPSEKLDLMNASQWREFANIVADNSTAYDRAPQNVNPTDPSRSNDWQDIYYRSAPIWNLNMGISGGGENATFNTSLGYIKQKGITIQSDFEKYNGRINSTYKKGIFSVQENLSIAYSKKVSAPKRQILAIPTLPVTDEQGRYISTPSELGYSIANVDFTNPLAQIYTQDRYTRKTDITGSLGITAELYKGLKYKLNLAGSYLNTNGYTHTPAYASYWNADGSPDSKFSQTYTSLSESRGVNFNYTIDNLLTYNGSVKKHNFDALLGTSWMRQFYRVNSVDSDVNDLGSKTITTYKGSGTVGSNQSNSALLSYFARLNYDYDDKYLLSISIRGDESSKFAKGNRVGYFPSVSAGWNIHLEPWFENKWVNKLKVRGSYGELGANFINPYSFLSLAYGPVPAIFNNMRNYGYVTRFAQQDLTWETAVSSNIGIEAGFFDNKIALTAEYFIKTNRDLLAPLEPLPSSGQTIIINDGNVPYYNTASVRNKGVEIALGYHNKWEDFSMSINSNVTFLQNEVLALGEGVQPIRGTLMSSKFNDRPTITKEGLPIGSFWGYQVAGIDNKGNFLYENKEGIATVLADLSEDDKRVIGNPTPDFTYGLSLDLKYKNWYLTSFFQGVYGNDILNAAKYMLYFNYETNTPVDALTNSWTSNNTNATLPIAKTDNYNGGNSLPSTFYIEDGSYLRLKNLQIGYEVSKNLLKRLQGVRALRVYAGVQNAFTITNYSLYDPEVSSNTLFSRGIDGIYRQAPTVNARVYTIGFNLTF